MTDFARLAMEIDSRQVKTGVAELDKLTAAGKRTQGAIDKLGDEAQQTGTQIKGATTAAHGMGAAVLQMENYSRRHATAAQAARAHMGNLAFQINDVVTGLAMGQRPMQVFIQQGGQIAQISSQMGVGMGGLAKQVGAMALAFARAHPILIATGGAAGVSAGEFKILTSQLNRERKADIDAFTASLKLTKDELRELGTVSITVGDYIKGLARAISEEIGVNIPKIFERMGGKVSEALQLTVRGAGFAFAAIYASGKTAAEALGRSFQLISGTVGNALVVTANAAIDVFNWLIDKATIFANQWIGMWNRIMSVLPGGAQVDPLKAFQVGKLSGFDTGPGAFDIGAMWQKSFRGALGTFSEIGDTAGKYAFDAMRKRNTAEAEKKGLLDDDAAKKAGARAGRTAGKAAADALAKALSEGIAAAMTSSAAISKAFDAELAFKTEEDMTAMTAAFTAAQKARTQGAIDEAEANALLADSLARVVTGLDQLGGAGRTLGNIGALIEGSRRHDYSAVTGPIGAMLQLSPALRVMVDDLGRELDRVFGGSGKFAETMQRLLEGAGLGIAGATTVLGGKGNNFGAALGGIAGQAITTGIKSISKTLGGAAGPIGAIVGGILGGLFGGLFSKTKTGAATLTLANGQFGSTLSGNNADRRGAAGALAGNVGSALEQIANALGGTLGGTPSVSIGIRKDSFRVDTTGQGRTKGAGVLDFGKDEAGAIKAAISDAIKDGVILGLRAGTEALLKGAGDLEKQLAKAVKFEGVFTELQQRTDPLGYALAGLAKELTSLTAIFTEAGASAADFASLTQLMELKRAEAIEQAAREARPRRELEIQIMELTGETAAALAASRALEMEGMEAGLRPLQARIYALQDEAAAAAEAAAKISALAAQRYDLETRLLQVQGNTTALRIRELALLDESLRGLQMQIYLAEDIAAARDTLTASYQRERGELEATARKFRDFADGLRTFRDSLFTTEAGTANYGALLAKLTSTGRMAALGNEASITALPGVSRAFLDASRGQAGSLLDYQRDVARVSGVVGAAIRGSEGMASAAERQLAALDKSVEGLIAINENVVSVEDAIAALRTLIGPPTVALAETQAAAAKEASDFQAKLVKEVVALRDENARASLRLIELAASQDSFFRRIEGGGLLVRGENDLPVYTTAAT